MDRLALQCLAAAESQWSAWEDWRSKAGSMAMAVGYEAYRARATRLRDQQPAAANDVVANDVQPETLLTSGAVFLGIGDIHADKHDRTAFELVRRIGIDIQPSVVWQSGDLADVASLNAHPKSDLRDESSLKRELQGAIEVCDAIDSFKAKRVVFTMGNHEQRVEREIVRRLPAVHGMVSIESELGLGKRGWEVHQYRKIAMIGDTAAVHDLENFGATAHEKALVKTGCSTMIGHTHTFGITWRGDALGRRKFALAAGHVASREATRYMSDATDDYLHQMGVITGVLTPDGKLFPNLHPIVVDEHGYRCVVNGKLYQIRSQHPRGAA